MTLDELSALAETAWTALPQNVRDTAEGVVIRCVDRASREQLEAVDMDSALDLTGLYEGIPLTEKSHFDQPLAPDTIWLFRDALEAELRERGTVSPRDLVQHVLVHELAHHFGWSDDDIAEIDPWWL